MGGCHHTRLERSESSFFKSLLDMDIEPGKVKEWIDFCSEISPAPPEGFIPAAMELFLKKAKSGDVLVVIRFQKDTNFDVEKLEWVPRLDELELINDAKKAIMSKHEGD